MKIEVINKTSKINTPERRDQSHGWVRLVEPLNQWLCNMPTSNSLFQLPLFLHCIYLLVMIIIPKPTGTVPVTPSLSSGWTCRLSSRSPLPLCPTAVTASQSLNASGLCLNLMFIWLISPLFFSLYFLISPFYLYIVIFISTVHDSWFIIILSLAAPCHVWVRVFLTRLLGPAPC